jgi:hypothetical protein
MASSVSSERAFSAGGITINKRRNRLNGDIVEALQFLKCAIRQDLLFKELVPDEEQGEEEQEEKEQDEELKSGKENEEMSWDIVLEEENYSDIDSDIDE